MKNTFSVLFYVKKQQKKSGLLPIMGRITVNKQTTQFFTQLEITPTEAIVTAKIKEKYGKKSPFRCYQRYDFRFRKNHPGHHIRLFNLYKKI